MCVRLWAFFLLGLSSIVLCGCLVLLCLLCRFWCDIVRSIRVAWGVLLCVRVGEYGFNYLLYRVNVICSCIKLGRWFNGGIQEYFVY